MKKIIIVILVMIIVRYRRPAYPSAFARFQKYGNRNVNDASLLPAKPLMGSYRSLTFAYFKPFPGLKYTAGPDWSKKFFNQ